MPVTLHYLQPSDRFRQNIERDFYASWNSRNNSGKPAPRIKHVFYLFHRSPDALVHLHANRAYMRQRGNEKMLYHGTRRRCNTGDTPTAINPCNHPRCSFCQILRFSFDPSFAAGGNFGYGIYTTSNPAKADMYTNSPNSRNDVILWTNVTLGRTYVAHRRMTNIRQAPGGADSLTNGVQGLPDPEMIIYRKEAICVNSIIIYE